MQMNALVFALLSMAEAFLYPNSSEQISRSLDQSPNLFYLNHSSAAQQGYCGVGWTYFDETDACYKNFFWANFDDAERRCRYSGGHLTSIHSYAENSFVAELAKMGIKLSTDAYGTWIGLVRSDYLKKSSAKNWVWMDGTKVDYLAWSPTEPDDYGGTQRCALV
ncbi:unnamed protein product [Cylicocyclus nassatus]|uniref:C-type lectin domain-containing protein n=1 Tax=Cylicocyclus nassatus TaxID=53992 RepID=A0AA36H0K5_CYLNA|nr:unnamed protein product [Cylicocyclus nassatus]